MWHVDDNRGEQEHAEFVVRETPADACNVLKEPSEPPNEPDRERVCVVAQEETQDACRSISWKCC